MDFIELRKLQNTYERGWAHLVVEMGYPNVAPILPELLGWMEDMNDPEAQVLAPFLATIGEPLIPHIRPILESSNDSWKCYILWHIVNESPEIARTFHKEIEKYAKSPTANESAEGLDEIAQVIMAKLNSNS